MEGVTTAIVAFLFVCIVFPSVVRNRAQFYAALAMTLAIIFLHSIAALAGNADFYRVVGGLVGLLQVGAIVMLILGAGGLSPREIADDAIRSFEVIRRGESEKEVIIKPARPMGQPAAPVTPAQPAAPAPTRPPQRQEIRTPKPGPIPLDE